MLHTLLVRSLLALPLMLVMAEAGASAVLEGLRLESVGGELRAVITVDGETWPKTFASNDPSLVVVDFADTLLEQGLQLPEAPAAGLVRGVRHALGSDGRLRLVFDLREPASYHVATVALNDNDQAHTVVFVPAAGRPAADADSQVKTVASENYPVAKEIAVAERSPAPAPLFLAQGPATIAPGSNAAISSSEQRPGAFVFGQQEQHAIRQQPMPESQSGVWKAEIERSLLETGVLTNGAGPADINNHLQLIGSVSRAFDNGFELRLTGRIDGHYQDGSGYSEGSLKADYGESWLRYRGDDWRVTVGAQRVVWGRADEISPIDRLSTPDLTRLMLDQRQARRRANPALRFERFGQTWSLDLVWLPLFREAELPEEDSLWHPVDKRRGRIVGLPSDPEFSALISAGRFNDDAPDEGGGGVRFRHFGQDLDYAFTLQRSRNPMPYYRLDEATREQLMSNGGPSGLSGPVIFDAVYPRSWVVGGDFGAAVGTWTFRVESTWSSDMPVTRDNLAFDTVAAWNWVVGAETFPGDRNFRVTLQLAGTRMQDADNILDREDPVAFNGELETPFAQNRWRASLRFNLGLDRSDVYLNPQLVWTGWEPHEFFVGAHLFDGDEVTLGGFYDQQDMVVFGWRGRF